LRHTCPFAGNLVALVVRSRCIEAQSVYIDTLRQLLTIGPAACSDGRSRRQRAMKQRVVRNRQGSSHARIGEGPLELDDPGVALTMIILSARDIELTAQ
jgi:hypothetical protein